MIEKQTDIARDEVAFTISDFVQYLWLMRIWLVVVPGLLVCLALSAMFFRATIPAPITFFIELKSINNGDYPNGSKFSPGDLIAPEIVEAIRSKYANAFTQEDFSKGVVVEYGSPLVRPLLGRYEILLSNKQLKPNEFDDLSTKLSTELQAISQRGVRIQIDPIILSLTRDQATQLALDIPFFWSKIFVEKKNIFLGQDMLDMSINLASFDASNGEDVLRASDVIGKMDRGLIRLAQDPRLQQLKTAAGLSIGDVAFSVRNLDLLYIRPLLAGLQQGAFSERFRIYQQEAVMRVQEVESRISGLDETINSLPTSRDGRVSVNASQSTGSSGVQLTDAGVSQLMKLGQQNLMSGYLQELLNQRVRLVEQRARLQFESERLRTQMGVQFKLDNADVTKAFESVSTEYRSLYQQAVLKLQRDNRFLYSALGAPTWGGSEHLKVFLMWGFGSFFMGLFAVLMCTFVVFVARGSQAPRTSSIR